MNRFLLWLIFLSFGSLTQMRAQETTTNNSNIRVSPARISLGSLSYGASEERVFEKQLNLLGIPANVRVTHIDLSHAPGVAVLSQKRVANGIEINLAVSEKAFTAKQPYGIFIKKVIRLETNSTTQPQFVVPVIGWLAVNETERNFNHYIFDGTKRWQGIWGTPNIAGSILAGIAILLTGLCAWLITLNKHVWLRYSTVGVLTAIVIGAMICLALTYSRGAWVAFIVGILILILSSGRASRKIAIGVLISFVIIICFLPSGLKRMESYSQIEGDKSIAHRLKLWTGAAQMMAEHPLHGVGFDRFGSVFSRDYQDYKHTTSNSTAVSDYFSSGAERGLLFIGIATGLLGFLFWYSFRAAQKSRSAPRLALAATLMTILVASAFSTLSFVRDYQILFILVVLGLLGFICTDLQRNSRKRQLFKQLIMQSSIAIAASLLVFGLLSVASLKALPTKTTINENFPYHLVQPRWIPAKGTIVYLTKPQEDITVLSHSTLRPLAALGWNVVWANEIAQPEQVITVTEDCRRRFPDSKIYLIGNDYGGKLAWQTINSTQENSLIVKAAGYGFLDESLLNDNHTSRPQIPFLLYHSIYDDQCSANLTILAQRKLILNQLPLTVLLSDQEPGKFSDGWMQWLKAVDQYLTDANSLKAD